MNWVNYLIQINLYLTVFYAFYQLFLKDETFFNLNRTYLLSAAFFSMMIPMARTQWVKSLFITEQVQTSWANVNVRIMQGFATPLAKDNSWAFGDYLTLIYLIVFSALMIRLIYKLIKVKQLFKSENNAKEAFSFFGKIKINPTLPNQKEIEKHELIHAKQLHSADVIFFELLAIINWFNPVCYFYKKSIKHIHEFIADEEAVKMSDKKEYAILLFSNSFGVNPNQLTNNFFNQSLLKRRIKMLDKQKSRKVAILKYGLSAPLFLLAMILSSAKISENKTISKIVHAVEPQKTIAEIIVPKAVENLVSKPIKTKSLNSIDTIPISKKADLNYALDEVKVFNSESNDPIYSNVEILPSFPGGLQAFGKFLGVNLNYPKAAKDAKIEGRVFAQFVVEKDGSLTDIKIVRGIGYGCDEEAKRVLELSPKWNPGIQNGAAVRVSYTVPIFFQINAGLSNSVKKDLTPEQIEKNKEKISAILDRKVLMVIDGVEIERNGKILNDLIKPQDIESMNVLKGDAATKKYGEKGKDGVIEITTKKKNNQ